MLRKLRRCRPGSQSHPLRQIGRYLSMSFSFHFFSRTRPDHVIVGRLMRRAAATGGSERRAGSLRPVYTMWKADSTTPVSAQCSRRRGDRLRSARSGGSTRSMDVPRSPSSNSPFYFRDSGRARNELIPACLKRDPERQRAVDPNESRSAVIGVHIGVCRVIWS